MPVDEYTTIKSPAKGLYKEKGSKFIALAVPVGSQEEAKEELEKIRKNYHDARHHCYAYRLGIDPSQCRYNDDGEPSGTAGRPIYGQILSAGLSDILVVVVRYFGGVKLGTSGLTRAYRLAARDAMGQAIHVPKVIYITLALEFSYDRMNEVMRLIDAEGLVIRRQSFGEKCLVELEVRKNKEDELKKKIGSLREIRVNYID